MVEVLPLLGVWLLAVITPGPDFLIVVQNATSRSRRHGFMAAVGVTTAILFWATGSMLGLAVLLTRLSWLYEIVRLAGAAYLIYLGIRTLWSSRRKVIESADRPVLEGPPAPASLSRAWRMGFLTNAANPKAAAFFGSLLGALMPAHAAAGLQVMVIASIVVIAMTWYAVVATMFGMPPVTRVYRRIRRWIDRVMATVLILLGGRLALDR